MSEGLLSPKEAPRSDTLSPTKAGESWSTIELAALSWKDLVFRDAMAWALTAMMVTALLGALVDVPVSMRGGAAPSVALATALFAAGLTAGLAAPTALFLTVLGAGARLVWLRFGRAWAWFVPSLLMAFAVGWVIMVPPTAQRILPRLPFVLVFTFAVTCVAMLARKADRLRNRLIIVFVGLTAIAIDTLPPVGIYREPRNLAFLLGILCADGLSRPLQHRLCLWPMRRLATWLGCGLALAMTVMALSGIIAPEWRREAGHHTRYARRVLDVARMLVDLDADGYSPILWGGDCNDLNDRIKPLSGEPPGHGDRNCNGVEAPLRPSYQDYGLAPPFGEPDMAKGAVDLVLLLTVDCLRADSLPDMPNLGAFVSRRGMVFDDMYAGATRTIDSLPMLSDGSLRGKPLAPILKAAGVRNALVLGVSYAELSARLAPGMDEVIAPPNAERFDAAETGRAVIEQVRRSRREDVPAFVWAHYLDPHSPLFVHVMPPTTEGGRNEARAKYDAGVRRVDHMMTQTLETLEREGALQRAVVLITADHGEAFGEHGLMYHNTSGYDVITHVPGILLAPGLAPARYSEVVSHRDIRPTILGAFGLVEETGGAERFGRSLLRLRQNRASRLHRFVATHTSRFTSGARVSGPMLAIVRGPYKFVQALYEKDLFELYDLRADPEEDYDLSWKRTELRESMRHDLAMYQDLDR